MKKVLALAVLVAVVAPAANANILLNGDFETHDATWYSTNVDHWVGAAWAPHSNHPAPNPMGYDLGEAFSFINSDPDNDSRLYAQQNTAETFDAGVDYQASGIAMYGGGPPGDLVMEIGYNATPFDNNTFVPLISDRYTLDGDWTMYTGSVLNLPAGDAAIGKTISFRWYAFDVTPGGPDGDDIWVDNFVLTPEPASLTLVALGGLALIRRRR